jgi:hypothetical protein
MNPDRYLQVFPSIDLVVADWEIPDCVKFAVRRERSTKVEDDRFSVQSPRRKSQGLHHSFRKVQNRPPKANEIIYQILLVPINIYFKYARTMHSLEHAAD